MTPALLIALGFVLGAVACWLVMRRDDKPSEIVAKAKAEADEIDAAAEVELHGDLAPNRKRREEADAAGKIRDKRGRFAAKADIANRKRGNGK